MQRHDVVAVGPENLDADPRRAFPVHPQITGDAARDSAGPGAGFGTPLVVNLHRHHPADVGTKFRLALLGNVDGPEDVRRKIEGGQGFFFQGPFIQRILSSGCGKTAKLWNSTGSS